MLSKITSSVMDGFEGRCIDIECDIANGLPSLSIVGLGSKAIDESRDRVRSAIRNSQLVMPAKRITLNLAPADLPKDGTHFDLGMAIAILTASRQIPQDSVLSHLIIGELGLEGTLRPVVGAIGLAQAAARNGITSIILPSANAAEVSLLKSIQILPADNLKQVYSHLLGEVVIPPHPHSSLVFNTGEKNSNSEPDSDFKDIHGQEQAKRALEIVASGGHNILLSGPPGTGKTMLAKALVSILPPLSPEEMIEVTALHSVAGKLHEPIIKKRPFRSPHHTSSHVALIGGGRFPKPGEVSLSNRGVLFLDELPEFPRQALETLRQPLEERQVTIARAHDSITFPANFILIATQNPCPCGFAGDEKRECSCTMQQIINYNRKISGPLLDRIDMMINVPRIESDLLLSRSEGETSAQIFKRVERARAIQHERYNTQHRTNATLRSQELEKFCILTQSGKDLINQAFQKLHLSTRALVRTLKVARTIADLEGDSGLELKPEYLAEALQYRQSN